MDGIKAWAIALCAAAVGCSLLHMLAPKGGMGRLFKLIIAAFFLCCMIAPLMNLKSMTQLDIDALPEDVRSDVLQERVNGQVERQINAALLRVTNDTLKNYNTQAEKVVAKMDTSADGGICITQIVLYMDKQNIRGSHRPVGGLTERMEEFHGRKRKRQRDAYAPFGVSERGKRHQNHCGGWPGGNGADFGVQFLDTKI